MISRFAKIRLANLFFGCLSLLEISIVSVFGTRTVLRYVRKIGLLSLFPYPKNDVQDLSHTFNRIAQRLRSDQVCFKKSLLLYHLYRKSHRQVAIVFGVRKTNRRLLGHCWITLDGQALEQNDYEVVKTFI